MPVKTVKIYFYEPCNPNYKPHGNRIYDLGKAKFFPIGMNGRNGKGAGNFTTPSIKKWLLQGNDIEKVLYIDKNAIDFFRTDTVFDFLKEVLGLKALKQPPEQIENPPVPDELNAELANRIPGEHDDVGNSFGPTPKLVSLLRYEEKKMLQEYVNEITARQNGIDGVFIVNAQRGVVQPTICISDVAGGGATFNLEGITEVATWVVRNAINDDIATLDTIVRGQGITFVDYNFNSAIVRLYYVITEDYSVAVSFICGDLATAPRFASATPIAIKKIVGMLEAEIFGI